jgi:hypothetical protein
MLGEHRGAIIHMINPVPFILQRYGCMNSAFDPIVRYIDIAQLGSTKELPILFVLAYTSTSSASR